MSRALTAPSRVSSSQLLARILETPNLAAQVQAMPPELLARVIEHVGLEDAGEIVAFATPEQLAGVFDEDLWKSARPGEDERFDASRFLVWLSVMLEAGDAFVASRLLELPPDLVTLAFHRQMLVIDMEVLTAEMLESGEEQVTRIEKALSNCLYEEIETYQLVARRHEGWDDVLTAVLALDRDNHEHLMGILERCCAMSAEYIEDNGGLYDVLSSEEMLESDVAAEREDRRAEAGHVAPSSAAAFLKLARTGGAAPGRDPLTRAYFRDLSKSQAPARAPRSAPAPEPPPDLVAVLQDAGITERPRPLLPGPRAFEPLVVRAMRRLAGEAAFFERSAEIAYLANVLAAGCSFQQRRLRPAEAVRAAIATASLGLELEAGAGIRAAVEALRARPADALFRVGYGRLHRDVVLPAARCAERALRETREPGAAARVAAALAAGTPWVALAEVALLEHDAHDALGGLMDECPTLGGAFLSRASDIERARERLGIERKR